MFVLFVITVENSVDTNTHMNSLSTKSTEINSNERGHLNGSFEMIPLDDDKWTNWFSWAR